MDVGLTDDLLVREVDQLVTLPSSFSKIEIEFQTPKSMMITAQVVLMASCQVLGSCELKNNTTPSHDTTSANYFLPHHPSSHHCSSPRHRLLLSRGSSKGMDSSLEAKEAQLERVRDALLSKQVAHTTFGR
jgi:hypothetical protein